MATAIAVLTDLAAREADQAEVDGVQPGGTWTRTAGLIGPQMPPDAADVVKRPVAMAIADHDLDPAQPWGRWKPSLPKTWPAPERAH